jgi:hypothetical protein
MCGGREVDHTARRSWLARNPCHPLLFSTPSFPTPMLSHRAWSSRWIVVDSFNYRMSFMAIGLSNFLELKNTDGCSCHRLWLESQGNCDGLVLWPLLQIPLCKQRSGLIAYGGVGYGVGINFSQSSFQPLPWLTLSPTQASLLIIPSAPNTPFCFCRPFPPLLIPFLFSV